MFQPEQDLKEPAAEEPEQNLYKSEKSSHFLNVSSWENKLQRAIDEAKIHFQD